MYPVKILSIAKLSLMTILLINEKKGKINYNPLLYSFFKKGQKNDESNLGQTDWSNYFKIFLRYKLKRCFPLMASIEALAILD